MASDRTRAAVRALVIAAAGAGGAVAATRGLYATALLAAMIAIWIAALNLVDAGRRSPMSAPPIPVATAGEEERRRLNAYLDLSPAPLVALDDGRLSPIRRRDSLPRSPTPAPDVRPPLRSGMTPTSAASH
jgi:two-component system nitrogen regulation sensor histidine kinase NtrY